MSKSKDDISVKKPTDIHTPSFTHKEANGIYYWKTTLDLDDKDYNYLNSLNVDRLYLRLFDIVSDKSPLAKDAIIPNATLQVNDSVRLKSVVPTIFITLEALKAMKGSERVWAKKIVDRVNNMCLYNNLGNLNEIQLDCDWTKDTESVYFELCKKIKESLLSKNPNAGVSSTIRLHQLAQPAPPVDYGVLMLYNTGSFKNIDSDNSILSVADVEPYIKNLHNYPLHLDFAYPTYSWSLIYRDGNFWGILRNDIADFGKSIRKISHNKHIVEKDIIVNEVVFHKGDIIRHETSPYTTIMEVKRLIESHTSDKKHSNIIYHYDPQNLSKYSDEEIASVFI